MIKIFFIFFLYIFHSCPLCNQVTVEKDFLLHSKEKRMGIYYHVNLINELVFTIGYEKMKSGENIISALSYPFKSYKFYTLYEKNSVGFAIEKFVHDENSIYIEINNLKEKELNMYYYHKVSDNIMLKIGAEKINKDKIDLTIGFLINF
ncbi:MAG: hypothetical protein NZM44_04025 [Candidatus Calescibacterium sp.]|nr:hypothetical protein [Candidatus Calescibacterium sp.]